MKTSFGIDIPASPFYLLQEIYIDDPWKIMVCCIMLNLTSRKQVDSIREEFFWRWPTPESIISAEQLELSEFLRPLGFYNKRAKTLIRFSEEWLSKECDDIIELHGIGKYAQDSWNIFVKGEVPDTVNDHVLNRYVEWRNGI